MVSHLVDNDSGVVSAESSAASSEAVLGLLKQVQVDGFFFFISLSRLLCSLWSLLFHLQFSIACIVFVFLAPPGIWLIEGLAWEEAEGTSCCLHRLMPELSLRSL